MNRSSRVIANFKSNSFPSLAWSLQAALIYSIYHKFIFLKKPSCSNGYRKIKKESINLTIKKEGLIMPKCGICGGEAPKQPCITEDGKCDLCGKKVKLAEEENQKKKE